MQTFRAVSLLGLATLALAGCSEPTPEPTDSSMTAFVGARLIDGTDSSPLENSVIVVADGVIQAIGQQGAVELPPGAEVVDLSGSTIIPGVINTHGHVGDVVGLESGQYSRENVLDQLGLYARYGVTTVVSLGGDGPEGAVIRDNQDRPDLDHARLYIAGPVLTPTTAEEAAAQVQQLVALDANWAKFRLDSNLGRTSKMPPAAYRELIARAHAADIPVAAHIIELADAKAVLEAGVDFIAHSVRDQPVDEELIGMLRSNQICLTPTLTRELSTFVYGERPDFFDDPFFQREADPAVVQALQDPERQASTRENAGAQYWREQLPLAQENLKALVDAGVTVSMGTDTGPAGRFQGYFEHLEMEMMAEAGLTPMQVLISATGDAATCVGLEEELGTLEPGKRADFVVLGANPLDDIRNTRSVQSVWINGNRVPGVEAVE